MLAFAGWVLSAGIVHGQPGTSGTMQKVRALLGYCDSLRVSNPAKGAAASANYPLIQKAAIEGLALTPAADDSDVAHFDLLAALGYYYQVKFDSAQYYFYQCLYAGKRAHSTRLMTNALVALIPVDHQLQQQQRVDSCKNLLQAIVDTTKDAYILKDGYSALGSYYQQRSYYSTAQEYLLRGVEIRRRIVDTTSDIKEKTDYAIQCYILSKVYQNADQNDKSLAILNEGRRFMESSMLVNVRFLSSFVEVYSLLGQIDSSLYYDAMLRQRTSGSPTVPSETVSASMNIAQYFINHHQYDRALPYVDRADSLAERSRSPILLYQARMMQGRYFQETGKYAQAMPLLTQALPVARQISHEQYTDILKYIALTQQGLGNATGALDYYKQYASQLDSLTKEKSSRNFADQQTRYETGQKELRIVSLDKDNKLKELELTNGRHVRWLLIAGLIAVGVFALLLFYFYRKLVATNDQLGRANETKARLFGIISHDLRSPVSRIVQLLQIQKERPDLLDEPTRRRHEARLQSASEHVLETMEDLLLWSKSQMQHFTPQPGPVLLQELVEKETGLLREGLEEKQLRVENRVPEALTRLTDENFLSVIVRNLLQNAVKYSVAGGTIVIAADGQHLYLTNPSPGVPAGELNQRLRNQVVNSKGSGLGLQIAADLAAALSVRIFFREEGVGAVTAVLAFE